MAQLARVVTPKKVTSGMLIGACYSPVSRLDEATFVGSFCYSGLLTCKGRFQCTYVVFIRPRRGHYICLRSRGLYVLSCNRILTWDLFRNTFLLSA